MTTKIPIVLWSGQYRNDASEIYERLNGRMYHADNLRLIGAPGDWYIVADAAPFVPDEGMERVR